MDFSVIFEAARPGKPRVSDIGENERMVQEISTSPHRVSTQEAMPETTRPLWLLWNHGKYAKYATLPGQGKTYMEKVVDSQKLENQVKLGKI